jgi:hypothetical protein
MDFNPTAMLARLALGEIHIHVGFYRSIQSLVVHA